MLLLPLYSVRLLVEIHFLFGEVRCLLLSRPRIAIERANSILIVVAFLIIPKCDLRLIFGCCALVESLIHIVVASAKWLANAWLYSVKSFAVAQGLAGLSQREIRFAAWIVVQFN